MLLIEAGGSDTAPEVEMAAAWPMNSAVRDWGYTALLNPPAQRACYPDEHGQVLGGGASINVMPLGPRPQERLGLFAAEAGDPAWSYESVLGIYREIETGRARPIRPGRGKDGLPTSHRRSIRTLSQGRCSTRPLSLISLFSTTQMARSWRDPAALPTFNHRIRDGRRQSIFRSYTYPLMNQPNLTVLPGTPGHARGHRTGGRTGVECVLDGLSHRFLAPQEVILSLGAIQTPKVLMQSGVGDAETPVSLGIPVVQHLPGGRQLPGPHHGLKLHLGISGANVPSRQWWRSDSSSPVAPQS